MVDSILTPKEPESSGAENDNVADCGWANAVVEKAENRTSASMRRPMGRESIIVSFAERDCGGTNLCATK